jgi:hypothetical protein
MYCAYDGTCIYKDDFKQFFENELLLADAIIYAGTIKDRYLSSTWKSFFDRQFYNGHRNVLVNKQIGYIISGPLRQIPNVRQILETYAQTFMGNNMNNLIGFVTVEYDTSEQITSLLQNFASQLMIYLENDVKKPSTFLGQASHLIFRDLVYTSKEILRADHLFYKKHKLYDYPKTSWGKQLEIILLRILLKKPEARNHITKNMIKPLEKVLP